MLLMPGASAALEGLKKGGDIIATLGVMGFELYKKSLSDAEQRRMKRAQDLCEKFLRPHGFPNIFITEKTGNETAPVAASSSVSTASDGAALSKKEATYLNPERIAEKLDMVGPSETKQKGFGIQIRALLSELIRYKFTRGTGTADFGDHKKDVTAYVLDYFIEIIQTYCVKFEPKKEDIEALEAMKNFFIHYSEGDDPEKPDHETQRHGFIANAYPYLEKAIHELAEHSTTATLYDKFEGAKKKCNKMLEKFPRILSELYFDSDKKHKLHIFLAHPSLIAQRKLKEKIKHGHVGTNPDAIYFPPSPFADKLQAIARRDLGKKYLWDLYLLKDVKEKKLFSKDKEWIDKVKEIKGLIAILLKKSDNTIDVHFFHDGLPVGKVISDYKLNKEDATILKPDENGLIGKGNDSIRAAEIMSDLLRKADESVQDITKIRKYDKREMFEALQFSDDANEQKILHKQVENFFKNKSNFLAQAPISLSCKTLVTFDLHHLYDVVVAMRDLFIMLIVVTQEVGMSYMQNPNNFYDNFAVLYELALITQKSCNNIRVEIQSIDKSDASLPTSLQQTLVGAINTLLDDYGDLNKFISDIQDLRTTEKYEESMKKFADDRSRLYSMFDDLAERYNIKKSGDKKSQVDGEMKATPPPSQIPVRNPTLKAQTFPHSATFSGPSPLPNTPSEQPSRIPVLASSQSLVNQALANQPTEQKSLPKAERVSLEDIDDELDGILAQILTISSDEQAQLNPDELKSYQAVYTTLEELRYQTSALQHEREKSRHQKATQLQIPVHKICQLFDTFLKLPREERTSQKAKLLTDINKVIAEHKEPIDRRKPKRRHLDFLYNIGNTTTREKFTKVTKECDDMQKHVRMKNITVAMQR